MALTLDTYLQVNDFTKRLRNISASFGLADIAPEWTAFRENNLARLLPDSDPFWAWTTLQPVTQAAHENGVLYTKLDDALRKWAVYSIWASYVLGGDVQQTKSGLVVKVTSESEPVDPRQRAELYRRYADLAYGHKLAFLDVIAPPTACQPERRRRTRRVSVVSRKQYDRFRE